MLRALVARTALVSSMVCLFGRRDAAAGSSVAALCLVVGSIMLSVADEGCMRGERCACC